MGTRHSIIHTNSHTATAWLVELSGHLQWWSVREFVEEFACIMNMQLDLRTEAVSEWAQLSLCRMPDLVL